MTFFCATRILRVIGRQSPSSKVWHRCCSKPPNCRLVMAARVVRAQPGTVVSCLSERGRGGWGLYMLIQK